jgi:hypothetical protein
MSKTATVKLKTEGVTQLTSELNKAAKAADNLEDSLDETAEAADDVGDSANNMSGGLDKMSGGLYSVFTAAIAGAKTFVKGLKAVKIGIASTGIGLLVIAIGAVAAAFTSSEEGQNKFAKIMGVIGSVTDNVIDLFADLGEGIISIFEDPVKAIEDFGTSLQTFVMDRVTNLMDGLGFLGSAVSKLFKRDFAGAMEDAKKGVVNLAMANPMLAATVLVVDSLVESTIELGKQVIKEGEAAAKVADMRAKAAKLERELLVDRSTIEAKIAALRLKSRQEEEFTAEQRKQALKDAQVLEEQLLSKEMESLQLKADAQTMENTFARSNIENLDKEATAIAAVNNIQTTRLNAQKSTQRELNRLNKEIEADEKRKVKEAETNAALLKAATQSVQQNEIDAVNAKYIALNELAKGNAETEKLLKEKQDAELLAISKKYAAKEEEVVATVEKTKQEKRQETIDAVVAMTQAAFSLFSALDQGRDSDDKKTAKKRFQRAKKMQMAATVMSTASAVIGALSPPPVGLGPTPAGIAASITAGLTGAASLVSIGKTRFDSGGTPDVVSPPSAGGNQTTALVPDTFAPSETAPTNLETLTDKPIKAFVVAQDMTSQQQLNANLLHHATL